MLQYTYYSTCVTVYLFQHQCYSIPITAPVLQYTYYSTSVTVYLLQHQCYIIPITAPVLQYTYYSTSVTVYLLQHRCYSIPITDGASQGKGKRLNDHSLATVVMVTANGLTRSGTPMVCQVCHASHSRPAPHAQGRWVHSELHSWAG